MSTGISGEAGRDMMDSTPGNVALAATLDFQAAVELAAELLDRHHQPLTLDASGVQHLGAPCLQILLSAARTWREDAVAFQVDNPSANFSEGLKQMGFAASDLTAQGGQP